MNMRLRVLSLSVLAMSLALPVAAQAPAKAASTAKSSTWTPPKTPWGHPDLQGEWTSDSARGIPTQRPDQFAGRATLTDEEYAQRLARDEQTIQNALKASGVQTGGRDGAWRGSQSFRQTSLIVEPVDGKMPPITPEA
jgi:hypothetical protein